MFNGMKLIGILKSGLFKKEGSDNDSKKAFRSALSDQLNAHSPLEMAFIKGSRVEN